MNNRNVNIQLIQTISILVNNIKSTDKKCKYYFINQFNESFCLVYILSHPFLNKLISFKFNFYDEELLDTFIAFLKSLAL